MFKTKIFILIFSSSILFTACVKKEKVDEIVVKEYLEVEAICTEDKKDVKVLFNGYLAHIYNKTKKNGFRHGNVSYKKIISKTDENYIHPSKVKFSKILTSTFAKSSINLDGLSYSSINRDVVKTNCEIKVLKRLNHKPINR